MGISIKGAGITLGGIAAFLILNKTLNIAGKAVSEIAEASKWRSYYKHGNHAYSTPPGYTGKSYAVDDEGHYIRWANPYEEAEERRKEQKEAKEENRKPLDISSLSETLERIAKAVLKSKGIDLEGKKEGEAGTEYSDMCDIPEEQIDRINKAKDNITELFAEKEQENNSEDIPEEDEKGEDEEE